MNGRFARALGTRQTDPDYCSALYGPRPRRYSPSAIAWALVCVLAVVVLILVVPGGPKP